MSYWDWERLPVNNIVGMTFKSVTRSDSTGYGDDVIDFETEDGTVYRMYHSQDCCESVSIDDINGDLQDLVGSPITLAEESTSNELQEWEDKDRYRESFTWTFYRFATVKGYVNIRWYGHSNGYYSERVDFAKVKNE